MAKLVIRDTPKDCDTYELYLDYDLYGNVDVVSVNGRDTRSVVKITTDKHISIIKNSHFTLNK